MKTWYLFLVTLISPFAFGQTLEKEGYVFFSSIAHEQNDEGDDIFFTEYSITDVYNVIEFSEVFNQKTFGVNNPDLIFPNQELLYLFPDGTWAMPVVKPGDTQESIVWNIFRAKEDFDARAHLELVSAFSGNASQLVLNEENLSKDRSTLFWIVFAILLFLGIIWRLLKKPLMRGEY